MKKTIAILLALLFLLQSALIPAAAEGETASDVPVLATTDEVAAFIREGLVARKTAIRFKADKTVAAGATLAKVCANTGNGAEGDYLRLALNYVLPKAEQDADDVYTLRPTYYTTAEQEAVVDAYVKSVVAGCTAQDDTEKARYLYDYLCENVTFDLENLYNDEDLLKYTAYGAVVNGRAVCQGFATLYYKLALAAGLNCRIVTGKRGDVAHAWNIIEIGEQWYHVDVSSGAQILDNSAYFMKRLFDGYTISYGDETAPEIQGYRFVIGNEDESLITGIAGNFLEGDHISWTLNKTTGVLVIRGTGKMPNASLRSCLPSYNDKDLVKEVVISEGITSFDSSFFSSCNNLAHLSLPSTISTIERISFLGSKLKKADSIYLDENNETFCLSNGCLIDKTKKNLVLGSNKAIIPDDGSVTRIGEYAFNDCGVTEISIPSGVRSISPYAFYNCTSLTDLHLSEGLGTICREAFGKCSRLKQLALPSTVTLIDYSAFDFCGALESITVAEGNKAYCSINNCLIDIKHKALITGCSNSVIPDNGVVTQIGRGDIDSSTIGYVEGGGTTDFKTGYAFNGCSNLKSITIPEGVTFVSGFNNCGLREIEFADSVKEIRGFQKCGSLRSIRFSNNLRTIGVDASSITYADGYAFYNCNSLTEVAFPDSVREIYGFRQCSQLTSVTIPPYCAKVAEHSFDDCDRLEEITILSKTVELEWKSIIQTNVFNGTYSRSQLGFNYDADFTVYGFSGSTAQVFAEKDKRAFVELCPVTSAPHNTEETGWKEPGCLPVTCTVETVCVDCHLRISREQKIVQGLGHAPGDPVPENVVAATCTTEGSYDSVTYCTRCGKLLSSTAEKIAMTPHSDNDHDGYCDDCEAYICEHPETSLQNAKAASCLENGYSGDTVCGWCGVTLTYGVTLPALGHQPEISRPAIAATCLDPGRTAEYTCSACGVVTVEAQSVPISTHADSDRDGLCDVCLAPPDCMQYGRCGNELLWYVKDGVLVISGSGASGEVKAAPWESCADSIDCVYLRDSVTAMDGAPFDECPNIQCVIAADTTTVSRCAAPVLYYADSSGTITLSGRDRVPEMDLPALLNAAGVLCIDKTVASLCFTRLSLHTVEGEKELVYDILKNGKIIDEKHFRLPDGTALNDFNIKPLGYKTFNRAFDALQDNPDRNLILSISCQDLLPQALKADSGNYTEQFVLHFIEEPQDPEQPEKPHNEETPKSLPQQIIERFQATLAAILSVFKKLFRLFKKK